MRSRVLVLVLGLLGGCGGTADSAVTYLNDEADFMVQQVELKRSGRFSKSEFDAKRKMFSERLTALPDSESRLVEDAHHFLNWRSMGASKPGLTGEAAQAFERLREADRAFDRLR